MDPFRMFPNCIKCFTMGLLHVLNKLIVYVGDRLHKGPRRDAKSLKRGLSCIIKKVGMLFAYACVC